MLTTGVDMVEVWRIRELREKFGDRFINRIFQKLNFFFFFSQAPVTKK